MNITDNEGETTLMSVSSRTPWHYSDDTVDVLLKAGADVNLRDERGYTALRNAVECSKDVVIDLLLNAGADVNITDKQGGNAVNASHKHLVSAVTGYHLR